MTANLFDKAWDNKGDYVRVGNLLVQGQLLLAGPIPGPGTFKTPPFTYVATGAENPAGFPVVFAAARTDANYIAIVQYASGAVDFMESNAPPALHTMTQITVKTSGQLAAGDKLEIFIGDK